MATRAEDLTDFNEDEPGLDLNDDADGDDAQGGDGADDPDADGDDGGEPAAGDADADAEVDVVGWGEEEIAAADEPEGIRNLREALKREKQRVRELEQKNAPKVDEVGEKPNFDDYFDNPEDYDRDYEAWLERKRAAGQREERQQAAARRQVEIWERQRSQVDTRLAELKVPGKDEARAVVEEEFPGELFAYLVKAGRDNAAALILGLGRSEEKRAELKRLADEGSLAEFIATAAIMATEVRVGPRKPATTPERSHGGMSGGAARTDQRRARLEREAEKTGNYSALVKYDSQVEKR